MKNLCKCGHGTKSHIVGRGYGLDSKCRAKIQCTCKKFEPQEEWKSHDSETCNISDCECKEPQEEYSLFAPQDSPKNHSHPDDSGVNKNIESSGSDNSSQGSSEPQSSIKTGKPANTLSSKINKGLHTSADWVRVKDIKDFIKRLKKKLCVCISKSPVFFCERCREINKHAGAELT